MAWSYKVAAGAYAGPGNNNYGGFYCWHNYVAGAYTNSNGNNYDMIYDCNYNAPTPTTSSPPPPASAAPASQGTREAEEKVEKLERVCRSARVDLKRLQKVPGPFGLGCC